MTINTLYELARNSVEKFASKVAFSMFEGDDVTYAEVGRRIEKVQEILTCAGLHAGDKVALLSSNMPNWGVCYFAVTSAGMVAVPILPDFSGEELDMIIAHSEAKALLVSDRLFTKLSKQTIERLNVVVRTKNLGVIAQRVKGEGSMAVPKPDDLAVIIYTSGTTSKPKGVMLTHAALCAQVGISSSIFPVLPDDVFLSVLPLSHTYECSIGMIYPFSMGARVVYLDRPPTASALMPALRSVRPTVMLIVPLIIEKIYRHQVLAKFNSNGFIIDVPNQLFRDRERAAVHQILSNGLCTAASWQNDVIIQPLRQLRNVFRAGDAVCIQHPSEFVTVDLRHMLQPLGKLVYAINLSIRGKIYAAQIQAQIHDLACRTLNRDCFGHRLQSFQRSVNILFFCGSCRRK